MKDMNWDIKIEIEKRTTDFGNENIVIFKFKDEGKVYNKTVDAKHMHNERERETILLNIAREATDALIVPKLVHGILHALVSSALRGENPLE